uniref:Tudor domain-containing protein 7B n=1 Tax=Electrophorus electricus TaxID=8005 RepID=A0A4W4GZH3_ELEEL
MVDEELVKKTLRAVLRSGKGGLPLSRLQAEYKELTGEAVPHRELGHATLDTMLRAMPSVVRVDRALSGEVMCYATAGKEMAHLTKLAARQHTAEKTGRPQMVNCQMRVKPSAPFVLNANPRTSLRQPDHQGHQRRVGGHPGGHGDSRPRNMRGPHPDGRGCKPCSTPPSTPTRRPALPSDRTSHSSSYIPKLIQSRLKEILIKHSNGFWVSKLPQLYRELYKQDLPSEAMKDLEQWTHICIVEKPCSSKPNELLLYPAKDIRQTSTPPSSAMRPTADRQPSSPFQAQQLSTTPSSSTSSLLESPKALSEDLKQKLGVLLLKYSSGLWAHALPKLYQDTYKTKLPEYVLDNLLLLSEICTIDYPMPDNPKRAILYGKVAEDENCNQAELADLKVREEVGRCFSSQTTPPLLIPTEEYPSVLVVEARSTNSVVLRYIGEGYSKALEKLEDDMKEYYKQDNTKKPLASLSSGQLTAVYAEEEEEILRAHVCEVMSDKVKVNYVDHGFSEVISKSRLLEMHEKFLRLPFQATKCKLAGLESFSQEPAVLKKFDSMARGKILLAELLEQDEIPLMVLYDMSQDDDVNINAACLRTLQEKSLDIPLQVPDRSEFYSKVIISPSVTTVCSDGTFCCQIPSQGLTKLNEILEKTETYFHSQVTSESLVSRPFCGKSCLARYKGRWSRVEITNLHGSRVLDILFVDLAVKASVEVIELREIPPPFLCDFVSIPPQAVRCCLADLSVSVGSWTPDAVQRLKDTILHCSDCSLKIVKVEESKHLYHVYLFTSKNINDPSSSLSCHLADLDLWKQHADIFLSSQEHLKAPSGPITSIPTSASTGLSSPSDNGADKPHYMPKRASPQLDSGRRLPGSPSGSLPLPPVLELPPLGQNMDIYVSVACHPGHFVLQPWQDMYKLMVLMEEMILYYNRRDDNLITVEKNQVYAAKVENNWHRVLVKGVLSSGLVSVYELDYGKHELVSCTLLRPLIQEFRQLPFQGITAQLAGVKPRKWSEEASIVFRNHIEKKPLVAQLDSVQEAEQPWYRRVTVYLVDTSQEDRDIWVHDLMAEFADDLTKAA